MMRYGRMGTAYAAAAAALSHMQLDVARVGGAATSTRDSRNVQGGSADPSTSSYGHTSRRRANIRPNGSRSSAAGRAS